MARSSEANVKTFLSQESLCLGKAVKHATKRAKGNALDAESVVQDYAEDGLYVPFDLKKRIAYVAVPGDRSRL